MLQHVLEILSFLRLNNIPLYVYNHILFIHSSTDGYLGCFYLSAIVNAAAMSMGVQISVQDLAFSSFEYIHRSKIAELHGNSVLNFF